MATRRRKRKRSASEEKSLARYWGYSLLLALYLGWFQYGFEPLVMVYLSSLVIVWTLFQVPVPCCARNRDRGNKIEFCRNDSSGLLGSCGREQHKWQNAFIMFKRQLWVQWTKAALGSIQGWAGALGVLVALASLLVGVTQVLLK